MAQAERRDLYLRPPLLSPDYARDEEGSETKRPRLTLRYLHELIEDIHVENDRLADQIDTLSNQLDELARKLDALDILRDDNEPAAGLSVRSARNETAAAAEAPVAGNAEEGGTLKNHAEDTIVRGEPEASRTEAAEAAAVGEPAASRAGEAAGEATQLEAAAYPAAAGSADASEAFAKEWAQIPVPDASPVGAEHGHDRNELPASLQERMIENVKEAARIAEEIAAQAAFHAAAETEREADRLLVPAPQTAQEAVEPDGGGASIMLVPAERPLAASPGHDGATALTPDRSLAGAEHGELLREAPAPLPEARQRQPVPVRETAVRYEATATVHTYIPPRAERHAGTKKRSFWSRLFRRASM